MPKNDDLNAPEHASDSADKHAHGTHGKSHGEEHLIDDARVEPGSADGPAAGFRRLGQRADRRLGHRQAAG